MTSTATPVSAAAEQEHYHNDNQDQFHGNSPLITTHYLSRTTQFNGVCKVLFPINVQPANLIPGREQFCSVFMSSSARYGALTLIRSSLTPPDQATKAAQSEADHVGGND